jgi:flavin-dependent dehydrogenase
MDKGQTEFDLAIVGGGPAGTSAAITAARLGARVVLLEAGTFPRQKVCGEFVSAEALDTLTGLLRTSAEGTAALRDAPSINRTRLFFGDRTVEADVSPAALSLPRYRMDALLWDAAKTTGVEVRAECEAMEIAGDGGFSLHTRRDQFTAKSLIIAAGRWSRFASDRMLPAGPKWIGVKAHYRERDAPYSTDLYFFENGYCGVQPIAADLVNACAMVRSDRAKSLQEVFHLHPALAARTRRWEATSDPVTTAPLVYRAPQPVRGNVVFVGDAAGFIDPFVGDGISIALRSGAVAARCLEPCFRETEALPAAVEAYRQTYARQFAPLLSAAARVRSILSMPDFARAFAFELLRLPGVMPLVIRKTRRAA